MDELRYPCRLADYAKAVGVVGAARSLGLAHPTVSLMISRGRQIFVMPRADGSMMCYEVKGPKRSAD